VSLSGYNTVFEQIHLRIIFEITGIWGTFGSLYSTAEYRLTKSARFQESVV